MARLTKPARRKASGDAKQLSSKIVGSNPDKLTIGARPSLREQVKQAKLDSDGLDGSDGGKNNHLDGISAERHNRIRNAVLDQLAAHAEDRDERNERYDRIIAEIAVQQFISSDEFSEYHKSNRSAIRNIRYPMTYGYLRDLTTNVMNTLFPMRQMYGSIATTPQDQQLITAFLQVMNRDAKHFGHYVNYYRTIFDGFAFNAGLCRVNWKRVRATRGKTPMSGYVPSAVQIADFEVQDVMKGNEVKYLDPYNCFWDASIEASEFGRTADFFAYVERKSDTQLAKMARAGAIVLPPHIREKLHTYSPKAGKMCNHLGEKLSFGNKTSGYTHMGSYYGSLAARLSSEYAGKLSAGIYVERPETSIEPIISREEVERYTDNAGVFDFERYIKRKNINRVNDSRRTGENELLHAFLRLDLKEYDLADTSIEMIYEVIILNGEYIVAFSPVSEAHGVLPIGLTNPAVELGQGVTPSLASIIAPYQFMSNSLMATFINQAIDDANNGVLAYDAKKVDMAKAVKDKSGFLGVNRDNGDNDNIPLGNYFSQLRGSPANAALLNAEAILRERANDFAPIASANQLATMNRPVSHQSRQLSSVMNLHTQVMSRIIAEQLVQPNNYVISRHIMFYGEPIKTTGDDGNEVTLTPSEYTRLDISITASDGMRGLDTIALTDRFDKLLNSMYQSPQLMQEYDIAAMTSYLFQLEGANIDVDSFKYPDPFSKLTPEQKQLAYQLLQQAAAAQAEEG